MVRGALQILPDLQFLLPEVPADGQERIYKAVVLKVERAVRCQKRVLDLENVDIVIVDQAPDKGLVHLGEPFRVCDDDHYHVPLEKTCGTGDRVVEALLGYAALERLMVLGDQLLEVHGAGGEGTDPGTLAAAAGKGVVHPLLAQKISRHAESHQRDLLLGLT